MSTAPTDVSRDIDSPVPSTVMRRRPSPQVEWVAVAGEVVAWNEEAGSLHLLDPIASLIFQLMDGRTSLVVTVTELAEAFGGPAEDIAGDVLSCAGRLEQLGLLERTP